MRVVSAELAAAIEATERQLRATGSIDWDGDGHDTSTAPPRVLKDDFEREPVTSGWGGAWTTSGGSASDQAVAAGVATQTHTSINVRRIAHIDAGATDVMYTVDVQLAVTSAAGAPVTQWAAARFVDSSNCYFARLDVETSGAVSIALYKLVTGAQTTLVAAVQLAAAHVAGDWWRIGIQAAGTALRAKAWVPGSQTEPAWQVTAVDGSLTTGTRIALMSRLNTGNSNPLPVVVTWDNVRIVTGNIDDISGQLGDLTVTRAVTGQLPDEVLVVEGISAATAGSSLVKGRTDDERLGAVQYWSRLNPDSPLFGKPRANRNARLGIELLTSVGWQSVPLLTDGVLRSLPVSVKDRRASLSLLDARDRFRTPVTLPAFVAEEAYDGANLPSSPGLEAGWIVSFALWRAGRPLSPPARAGAALWIPGHGSMMPFVGAEHVGGPTICYTRPNSPTLSDIRRVVFDTGPFFLAPTDKPTDTNPTNTMQGIGASDGTAIFKTTGQSSGRIEFWARIPASPSTADLAAEVTAVNTGASAAAGYGSSDPQASLAIRRDGVARLRLDASTGAAITVTVTGPTYVHDGQWHLYGAHWDSATGACTFYRDGVTNSVPFAAQPAGDPAITTVIGYTVSWLEPISEIHITGGLILSDPWQPQTWDSGCVVDRPQNRRLLGCYPDGTVQAWTLLQQVYGAERGLVFIDPDGTPQLWTAARANNPDALTPVRTVTSTRDLLSLGYRDDRDMVRNITRSTYTEVSILSAAPLWSLATLVRIEPGQTWTTTITLDHPIASTPTLAGTGAPNGTGAVGTYVAITAAGSVRGTVTTTSPISVTATVTNLTAATIWLLDVNGDPDLVVTAQMIERASPVTVEVRDQASIDAYGDSPLDVPQNPWSQTRGWALGTVYGLLAALREEQLVYVDIEIPGDPRLDPLDRLQVQDRHGLMLDTEVTLQQRSDAIAGGRYNSTLVARPARNQWLLGGVGVGTPLGETIIGGTP